MSNKKAQPTRKAVSHLFLAIGLSWRREITIGMKSNSRYFFRSLSASEISAELYEIPIMNRKKRNIAKNTIALFFISDGNSLYLPDNNHNTKVRIENRDNKEVATGRTRHVAIRENVAAE